MKYDLKDITFLFHVRIDTEERAKNVQIITDFYRKHCENYFNIFIEDDSKRQLLDIIELKKNDTYVFSYNDDAWNKCASFNKGILLAKTNVLAFHDLDAILNPTQIIETRDLLLEDKNAGLLYPYNGLFLCVSKDIKNEFAKTLDIQDLYKYWPKHLAINYHDGNILVGHNNSVGGCAMGRRDNVIKGNGYNPNFKGWGYEDNEFPKRLHNLGYNVSRITGSNAALWHLPHDGPGSSPKAENPYYEHNRAEVGRTQDASAEDIRAYMKKSWSII